MNMFKLWKWLRTWVGWWASNQLDFEGLDGYKAFRKTLDSLFFRPSRAEECFEFASAAFVLANTGFKAASERMDKLLGIVLVVTGWLLTSAKTSTSVCSATLWVLCVVFLILSVITLLLGRWKLEGRGPAEFATFVENANKRPQVENDDWKFEQARQFALAAHEIQNEAQLVQIRLLISIILLIAGLSLFALRGI